MAVYYYLAVACADQDSAAALTEYFNGLSLTLAGGLTTTCQADYQQTPDHAWWSVVRPFGASIGGYWNGGKSEPTLMNRDQRSEIGRFLYERLRGAPPFLYALYGSEILDCFFDVSNTYNEVLRDLTILCKEGWHGLVVQEPMWEGAGRPEGWEPFRPGYYWAPYEGEKNW
jgi:hypothetical protein